MVSHWLAASYDECIPYVWNMFVFCPQNLSRSEPIASGGAAARAAQAKKEKRKRMPKLEEFLQSRDYVGAMTLLDVSYYLFSSIVCVCISGADYHCYGNQPRLPRMRTPHPCSSFAVLGRVLKKQIYGWHTVHSMLGTMSKQEQWVATELMRWTLNNLTLNWFSGVWVIEWAWWLSPRRVGQPCLLLLYAGHVQGVRQHGL